MTDEQKVLIDEWMETYGGCVAFAEANAWEKCEGAVRGGGYLLSWKYTDPDGNTFVFSATPANSRTFTDCVIACSDLDIHWSFRRPETVMLALERITNGELVW